MLHWLPLPPAAAPNISFLLCILEISSDLVQGGSCPCRYLGIASVEARSLCLYFSNKQILKVPTLLASMGFKGS